MIDFNAYIGEWPFYKLPRHTLRDMLEVHKDNGIDGAYVSSVHSIFYNDFYESEKDLANILKDSSYFHVVTVNPALPECEITLRRCIKEFDVKGIRIHPGYHGYSLTSDLLTRVVAVAEEYDLPIFVTARMMGARLTHMMHIPPIAAEELKEFIERYRNVKIILCHFDYSEIIALGEVLFEHPRLYTDITSFCGNLFGDKNIEIFKKAVFGSGFPLYPVATPAMIIKNELEDEAILAQFIKNSTTC